MTRRNGIAFDTRRILVRAPSEMKPSYALRDAQPCCIAYSMLHTCSYIRMIAFIYPINSCLHMSVCV